MKPPTLFDQLIAILALPFMVVIVIPGSILFRVGESTSVPLTGGPTGLLLLLGSAFAVLGLILFALSLWLFVQIGKGTLAPWNPTQKLVIRGLYRYVRNPMILGVLSLLLAEACLFSSGPLLGWAALFFIISHVYFLLKEEPDLVKRFGQEYLEYKNHVPRWLPRWSPWRPEDEPVSSMK